MSLGPRFRPVPVRSAKPLGLAFVAMALGLWSTPARAGGPEFLVEVDPSCPTIRGDKVGEHLESESQHELQIVDGVWAVKVVCEGTMVDVSATRPATGARASRLIPAPGAEDPERERILALATLPLLRLAKAEVAPIDPPEVPEPEPEPEPPEPEPEPPAPEPEPEPDLVRVDSVEFEAGAATGGSLAPPIYPRLSLMYSHWFGARWGLRAGVSGSFGTVLPSEGRVVMTDVPVSALGLWRGREHALGKAQGRLMLELGLEFGLQYMRGSSELEGVVGEPLAGPSGGVRGGVAYYFGLKPAVDLGVAVIGGYRAFGIIGRVYGQETLSWIGPWGGLALRIRFGVNRPQSRER